MEKSSLIADAIRESATPKIIFARFFSLGKLVSRKVRRSSCTRPVKHVDEPNRFRSDRSTFGNGVDVVQGVDTRLERMKGDQFHHGGKLRQINHTRLDLRKIDADFFEFSNTKQRVARRMFVQNIQIRLSERTASRSRLRGSEKNSYHWYCFYSRKRGQ